MTEFQQKNGGETELAISCGSLAAGAGRISAQVNQGAQFGIRGQLAVKLKMGAAVPSVNKKLEVWLVRGGRTDGTQLDESLGTADAAVASMAKNLDKIGEIIVDASANTVYEKTFFVEGIGRYFSILVWNAADQALAVSSGDHSIHWQPIFDEVV